MSHFAKVNPLTKKVENVIVAEQDFINSLEDKSFWLQTSYNTFGGVHILGGTPIRYNFACIGYNYDVDDDAFYPPKPFASWVLNKTNYLWEAPVPLPANADTVAYKWNEETTSWDEVTE